MHRQLLYHVTVYMYILCIYCDIFFRDGIRFSRCSFGSGDLNTGHGGKFARIKRFLIVRRKKGVNRANRSVKPTNSW